MASQARFVLILQKALTILRERTVDTFSSGSMGNVNTQEKVSRQFAMTIMHPSWNGNSANAKLKKKSL